MRLDKRRHNDPMPQDTILIDTWRDAEKPSTSKSQSMRNALNNEQRCETLACVTTTRLEELQDASS